MEKEFKVILPDPPSYLNYRSPKGYAKNSQFRQCVVHITTLNEEEVIQLGEQMKQQFIEHWEKLTLKKVYGK